MTTTLSPAWQDLASALVDVAADEIASAVLYADYVESARELGWISEDYELTSDDAAFLRGEHDHEISSALRFILNADWALHRLLVLDVQRRVRKILADAMRGES